MRGPFEAPHYLRLTEIEERPGFPGARRASGGMGGPFEAPHYLRLTETTLERPGSSMVTP